jgi:cyclohexanecarboxylate-CoA ligase
VVADRSRRPSVRGRDPLEVPGTSLSPSVIARYTSIDGWRAVTLGSYLSEAACARPHSVAAVSRSAGGVRQVASYEELLELAGRVATGLKALGLEPGDSVSVMLPNCLEFAAVIFGILECGAIYTGIPVAYGRRETTAILRRTRGRVLFVPAAFGTIDHLALVRELRTELQDLGQIVVLGEAPREAGWIAFERLTANAGEAAETVSPGALAHIGFTSGTTGEPKGAMNTHQTLDFVAGRWIEHVGEELLNEDTVNLIASPVGHHTGFLWGVLMSARLGCRAIMLDRWSARAAADVIREEGVTAMIAAPTFLQDLVELDGADTTTLPTLRLIAIAGAPIPRALVSRARPQLGCFVCPAWGMTEWGIGISGAPALPRGRVDATDGVPVAGCDVRVVDGDDDPVDAEVEGELQIKGPGLFVGYYERPDATEESFVDGWFRTGDRAVIHADGFVSLTGRSKDVIIRGGENIPAVGVESLLYEHAAIIDVAVVGVPDERLGERACAVVVLRTGSTLDLAEACRFLLDRGLSKHFLPERLEVVQALPKTPSGKIRKVELRDWLVGAVDRQPRT